MATPSFRDMVAFRDMIGDPGIFFAEHFGRQPLHRVGPLAHRVAEILSIRQMSDVAALEAIPPACVRIVKGGKRVSSRAFTRPIIHPGTIPSETLIPAKIYDLYHSGATVTWNSLDQFLPSVRQLLRTVTDVFDCGGEVAAFLTPSGNPGFAPHHDPVDVYVVQIEGSKDWRIWDRSAGDDANVAAYRAEDLGVPALQITLRAGDVLYLPARTPHAATAQLDASLHLGLSVETRSWRSFVHGCVDALMDGRFDESPYLGASQERLVSDLTERLRFIQERFAGLDPTAELARMANVARPPAGGFSQEDAAGI